MDVEEVPGTDGLGHGPRGGGECRVQQSVAAACDGACLRLQKGSGISGRTSSCLPCLTWPANACVPLRISAWVALSNSGTLTILAA